MPLGHPVTAALALAPPAAAPERQEASWCMGAAVQWLPAQSDWSGLVRTTPHARAAVSGTVHVSHPTAMLTAFHRRCPGQYTVRMDATANMYHNSGKDSFGVGHLRDSLHRNMSKTALATTHLTAGLDDRSQHFHPRRRESSNHFHQQIALRVQNLQHRVFRGRSESVHVAGYGLQADPCRWTKFGAGALQRTCSRVDNLQRAVSTPILLNEK